MDYKKRTWIVGRPAASEAWLFTGVGKLRVLIWLVLAGKFEWDIDLL